MFKVFLFLLVFTPLAFGTVQPWSYAVMEICTFAALLPLGIKLARGKESLVLVPGLTPFLLFLAYILFQLIPLPPEAVHLLSPSAFHLHDTARSLSDPSGWMTLSIHPAATLREFFRWASYAAFYVLTIHLLKEGRRLKTTVLTVAIFGALLSLSSILQFYLTDHRALWLWETARSSFIVGPYINHNHYAGLMEMIFPVILALFFFHRPRVRNVSLFKGIVEILSQEKANIHILIGMAALLTAASVFVSLSRGGMIGLCLSLVFFTYLLFKRKINRANGILIIVMIALTAAAVGWFGWERVLARFDSLSNVDGTLYEGRLDIWKDTLEIIRAFPLTGSGIGTFADIYTSHQHIFQKMLIDHAHGDYLELLAEGGVVGFLLAAAFMITLFRKTYQIFLARRDAYAVYIYMGSMTGITAILIHSLTDFNLHIGANGLWFFFLAGLAVSAAHTSMHGHPSKLPVVSSRPKKQIFMMGAALLAATMTLYNLSSLTGKYYFSHIQSSQIGAETSTTDLQTILQTAGKASFFDPLNEKYRFAEANAALFMGNWEEAQTAFKRAIRLDPANSTYLKRLGNVFVSVGDMGTADRLLASSVETDISNAKTALEYGGFLLSSGEPARGLAYIKRALETDAKLIDSALTTMAVYNVSDEEMKTALPEIPGTAMAFADFLYSLGKKEEADAQYRAALSYGNGKHKIPQWEFMRIYGFFKKRGNTGEALKVLVTASEMLPKDAQIRISLGDTYRELGISYRAREEYRQALLLDSKNKTARQRLEAIGEISP